MWLESTLLLLRVFLQSIYTRAKKDSSSTYPFHYLGRVIPYLRRIIQKRHGIESDFRSRRSKRSLKLLKLMLTVFNMFFHLVNYRAVGRAFGFSVQAEPRSADAAGAPERKLGLKRKRIQCIFGVRLALYLHGNYKYSFLTLVLNAPFSLRTFIKRLFRGEKFEDEVESSSLLCRVALQ